MLYIFWIFTLREALKENGRQCCPQQARWRILVSMFIQMVGTTVVTILQLHLHLHLHLDHVVRSCHKKWIAAQQNNSQAATMGVLVVGKCCTAIFTSTYQNGGPNPDDKKQKQSRKKLFWTVSHQLLVYVLEYLFSCLTLIVLMLGATSEAVNKHKCWDEFYMLFSSYIYVIKKVVICINLW